MTVKNRGQKTHVHALYCIYILAWYLCIYMYRESGSDSEVDAIYYIFLSLQKV